MLIKMSLILVVKNRKLFVVYIIFSYLCNRKWMYYINGSP